MSENPLPGKYDRQGGTWTLHRQLNRRPPVRPAPTAGNGYRRPATADAKSKPALLFKIPGEARAV